MKRIVILLLCLCLCLGTVYGAAEKDPARQVEEALAAECKTPVGALLADREMLPAGNSGSDWLAMVLALNDIPEQYEAYLQALEDYVTGCYAKNGDLSKAKATEYHRIALTVLALGGDPTRFGKNEAGAPVDLIAEGTYAFRGTLGAQGLNGWIFALIALDAGNFPVPADAALGREEICAAILEAQEPDGGFGLVSGGSDVDITAMALQALAPYRDTCGEAVEKALTYLSAQQTGTGGFVSYGAENPESCAQVLIALAALGIDPAQDQRFRKNGRTPEEALETFARPDGTYVHALTETKGNLMATTQVLLARTALARLRSSGKRLYDMTERTAPPESKSGKTLWWVALPLGLTAAAAMAGLGIRGKKHGKTH